MKKSLFALLIFLILTGLLPGLISGQEKSTIYFKTIAEEFGPGSEFAVTVFLDSQQAVNVLDLEINYSNLEFLGFNNANSIIDIWRNNPQVLTSGVIQIQGGLSKPFSGKAGEVIKLNFRALKSGLAELSFSKAVLYLADGLGTEIQPNSLPLVININPQASLVTLNQPEDKTPPVVQAEITKNPLEDFDLIVFSSRDNESGIKQVYFRSRQWLFWNDWRIVNNPVRLPASAWTAQLKAVDNQDNAAVQTFYVKKEIAKKLFYLLLFVILIGTGYYVIRKIML